MTQHCWRETEQDTPPRGISALTIKQVQRNPRTVSDFFSPVILKGTCKLPGTISADNLAIQQTPKRMRCADAMPTLCK